MRILILMLIVSISAYANKSQTQIETPKVPIQIGTFLEVPSIDILLSVDEGRETLSAKEKRIQYTPSATTRWGINLAYNFFEFKYKTLLFDEDSARAERYGKSKYDDYSLKMEVGNFTSRVFYQETKGFYADLNSNSGSTFGGSEETTAVSDEGEEIIIRNDLRALNWGVSVGYDIVVYDPRDSRALFGSSSDKDDFEIGFKLLSAIDYSNFVLEGSDFLIPPQRRDFFSNDYAELTGIGYQRLGADIGLAVNWYFAEKWTVFVSGKGGPGLQITEKIYADARETRTQLAEHMNFDFGFTYKSKQHAFRTAFEVDSWSSEIAGGNLDVQRSIFGINYTYSM